MSVPVSQLTVEQAYKEFNSLADKIIAKYEQLVSGKFGAVGTTGFNAISAKFGMSICLYKPTMPKTEHANAHTTSEAAILQELKNTFSDLNLYSRQGVLVRVWRM